MQQNELPKWRTTESKYLVNNKWLKLRADTCIVPDGRTIQDWYVLEYPEWINCLAIDQNDNVILLRHYRQGAGEYVAEIVSGTVDGDDSPEAAIAKELQEEIGYQGGELYKTGVVYANPSNQNNKVHTFLAVGGACTGKKVDELGANFVAETVPFKKFVAQVSDPNNTVLYQSLHVASIFFALNFIRSGAKSPAIERLRNIIAT